MSTIAIPDLLVPDGWTLTGRGMSYEGMHALDAWIGLDADGEVRVIRLPAFTPAQEVELRHVTEQVEVMPLDADTTAYFEALDAGEHFLGRMWDEGLPFDRPPDRDNRFPRLNVVSVAEVMRSGVTPPEMLVEGLLPVGCHATLYGPKENGKTWLVLAALVRPLLLSGRTVVYVDKEMSRIAIAERLALLGVPDEAVERHFVYLELPALTEDHATRREWAEMLASERPALVLADASAGVLADAGLDENRTPDVLKWDAWYFAAARRAGATTLMLDHTGHDSGGRARGASGKGAAAKVELEVRLVTPFDREHVGRVRVSRRKNTLAAPIPAEQDFDIGGAPFVFRQSADLFAVVEDGEGVFAERVMRVITEAGSEGLHTKLVVERAGGDRSKVTRTLHELVEAGKLTVRSGARGAKVYTASGSGSA